MKLGLQILLALVVASGVSCAKPAEPTREILPHHEFAWGLYQIYHGSNSYDQKIEKSLAGIETEPKYIMFYRDLGRGFPAEGCRVIANRDAYPMLSLELWHWGGGRDAESKLPEILTGDYDGFFRSYAEDAREYGSPVFLRFGFEMNGNWFSWGNQPTQFIAAWQRAHSIFAEEGADNVIWVWSPNFVSIPRQDNPIESYYPGDEFVDWVGLDGYNFGDNHDEWHRWEDFSTVFDTALDLVAERYPDKPLMLAEFSSASGVGSAKANWIRDAFIQIGQRSQIMAAVWFNLDKRREGEQNWRIDSDPGSLDAFNETFARPVGDSSKK